MRIHGARWLAWCEGWWPVPSRLSLHSSTVNCCNGYGHIRHYCGIIIIIIIIVVVIIISIITLLLLLCYYYCVFLHTTKLNRETRNS